MSIDQPSSEPLAFLNSGEAAELIARFPWHQTSLGPIESWPPVVKATVGMLLRSPVPLVTLWGEDGYMIYNDAYSIFAGGRHPTLLGSKVREGWPEVADFNDHVMKTGLAGETLSYTDQELTLFRSGASEQVWMNLDYSPIPGEDGRPIGVMAVVVETTAKVAAERKLSGEHERLRQMFHQAPGFIAILQGPDHTFQLANDAYLKLIGRQDIVGRPLREALPEVAEQGFVELLDQVRHSGAPYIGRSTPVWIERDGEPSERFLDFIYQPLVEDDGEVTGIFVQGQDVTDERRAEQELRENQEQLAAFISQSTAGFAQVDLEARFTLVNDRFCEITGRSREELLSLTMLDITHPDDRVGNVPKFERAVAQGTPYIHEKRYVRPDGSVVWVNNSVSVVRRRDGQPYGVLAVTIDVTERRKAEAAVKENEQRLRALTENLPGGAVYQIETGADGASRRFTFMSDSFERLTGVAAAEAMRDPLIAYRMIHPDDRAGHAEAEQQAIESGIAFDREVRFCLPDGNVRWFRMISAPRKHADGALSWDGILIDISEQKRGQAELLASEERLRQLNDSLEERVVARTEELERVHEQLRQSQKLEAMGQLTGGVAHDFNNLLTPIVGSLDRLHRKGIGDEREQRLIANAVQAAERAKMLVHRLLAFARRQPLQPVAVDMGELISGMIDLLGSTLGPQIRLTASVPDNVPPAHADRNQLEMALLNLSVNARDAMPDGGSLSIAVSCETRAEDDEQLPPGQYIRLSVTDTGEGMDEETQARAIEPFFSTKGIGQGTGLGLSMVHGLMLQLGGILSISSERGQGTTIDLILPAAAEAAVARPLDESARPDGPGRFVLLVEDEQAVRLSTADMLTELGHTTAECESAEEALALIEGGLRPDLIITDHLMPGISGAELAAIVSRSWQIPILIMSGYAGLEGLAPQLPRLTKPFVQSELGAAINAVLRPISVQ